MKTHARTDGRTDLPATAGGQKKKKKRKERNSWFPLINVGESLSAKTKYTLLKIYFYFHLKSKNQTNKTK